MGLEAYFCKNGAIWCTFLAGYTLADGYKNLYTPDERLFTHVPLWPRPWLPSANELHRLLTIDVFCSVILTVYAVTVIDQIYQLSETVR